MDNPITENKEQVTYSLVVNNPPLRDVKILIIETLPIIKLKDLHFVEMNEHERKRLYLNENLISPLLVVQTGASVIVEDFVIDALIFVSVVNYIIVDGGDEISKNGERKIIKNVNVILNLSI